MSRAEAIDPLSNRLMHFLDAIVHPRHCGELTPDIKFVALGLIRRFFHVFFRFLREQMLLMTYSICLKSVIKSRHLFTPAYVASIEQYAPLPLSSLVKVNSMRHLLKMVKRDEI